MAGSLIRDVGSVEEWEHVKGLIEEGRSVIVIFTAPWCKPCEAVYEIVEGIMKSNLVEGLQAFKLNVQDLQEIALDYRVLSVPTVMVFKGGKLRLRISGVPREKQIVGALQD
ncbi:MAG: thioredoxin family protein [Desulfurococcales archaeon]|nr:thioredoxin family protein [Desulfurococcales archaeon]